jgi:hypothetical protein
MNILRAARKTGSGSMGRLRALDHSGIASSMSITGMSSRIG